MRAPCRGLQTATSAAAVFLMLVVFHPAYGQQCSATYKMLTLDYSGSEGIQRMEMASVEVDTGTAAAHTRVMQCPGSTKLADQIIEIQGCSLNDWNGGNSLDLAWWNSASATGGRRAPWWSTQNSCSFDHRQAPPDKCCTPVSGSEHMVLILAPSSSGVTTVCWSTGSGIAAQDSVAEVPINAQLSAPISIKQLYQNALGAAGTMMNAQLQVSGCVQSQVPPQMLHNVAPFATDAVSNYFRYMSPGQVRAPAKSADAYDKETIFSNAEARFDPASGQCSLFVTLEGHRDLPPMQLEKVDDVDTSCLIQQYPGTPLEYIALDVVTALKQTSGASAPRKGQMSVVLKNATHTIERTATLSYRAYSALKMKVEDRRDRSHRFKCWKDRSQGNARPAIGQCTRATLQRQPNDAIKQSLQNELSESKFAAVVFMTDKNLKSGAPGGNHNPVQPDWESGQCKISVTGLFDAQGNDLCATPVSVSPVTAACSNSAMAAMLAEMDQVMTEVADGELENEWTLMIRFTNSDAWTNCASIVKTALVDATTAVTVNTDNCVAEMPNFQQSPAQHCANNPNDAWCADPCCNLNLQSTMCCAPRPQTVQLYTPTVDPTKFGAQCTQGAAEMGDALNLALQYADSTSKLDKCFAKQTKIESEVAVLRRIPRCCFDAVIGTPDSNGRFVSSQACSTDDDCYSGACIQSNSNSQQGQQSSSSSSSGSSSCFSADETQGKTGKCSVKDPESAAESLAQCLVDRLSDQPKTIAMLKKMFANNITATDRDIGEGIVQHSSYSSCRGDDGWMYDPNNDCQYYNSTSQSCQRICFNDEDCKNQCLAQERCNWKQWNYDQHGRTQVSANECLSKSSTHYCAALTDWGGEDDISEPGMCKTTTGARKSDHGDWYETDSHQMSESDCQSLNDPDVTLQERNQWHKYCGYANASSSKTDCLDSCIGSSGYQPPRVYQCYVDTAADGSCPKVGNLWFTERRVRWDVHLPHEVKRPAYCAWNLWGPGGIRETAGEPWHHDVSESTKAAWSIVIHGNSYPIYNNASWNAIRGNDHWWDGLSFTSEASANLVCAALGASVRLEDDGSNRCGEDRCVFDSPNDRHACQSLAITKPMMEFEWMSDFKQGAGVCFGRPAANFTPAWYNVTLDQGKNAGRYHANAISSQPVSSGNVAVNVNGASWAIVRLYNWQNKAVLSAGAVITVSGQVFATVQSAKAIPHPRFLHNGQQLAEEECYKAGSHGCDHGVRDHDWSIQESVQQHKGPAARQERMRFCSASGGRFVPGRHFTEGQMDSAAKCSGTYCSVAGPRYSVDSSTCSAIGGRCRRTDGCLGCRSPWWGEDGITNPREGACVELGISYATCVITNSGTYDNATSTCLYENIDRRDSCEKEWVNCDAIDPASCTPGVSPTDTQKYISKFLKCRVDKEPRFCRSKQQCEAEGHCHGPSFDQRVCWRETSSRHTCRIFDSVCIVPTSGGSDSCGVNCTAPGVERWGGHCWDPRNRQVSWNQCANYYMTQQECSAASGQWLPTSSAGRRSFCTSQTRCEGGRSERDTRNRNRQQCEQCGGAIVSDGRWQAAQWVEPAMVSGGRQWKQRKMEKTNTWTQLLDFWRVNEVINRIGESLSEEGSSSMTQCVYGQESSILASLAAICASDRLSGTELAAKLAAPQAIASSSVFPGVAETVGNSGGSTVAVGTSSFTSEAKVTLAKTVEGRASAGASSNAISTVFAVNALQPRSSTSLNTAACWAKVRNGNGALVGQLLGDCSKLQVTGSLSGSVQLCLPINTNIERSSLYPAADFARRTGTSSFSYTPAGFTVSDTGTHVCASVSETDTLFCPILRTATWPTATSDVGTSGCAALDTIVVLSQAATGYTAPSSPSSSPSSSTPSPSQDSDDSNSFPTGAVAGGAAAGAVLIAAAVVGVMYMKRRQRRPTSPSSGPAGTAVPPQAVGQPL